MAFETEEPDLVSFEQFGICRSMRRMARLASFDLDRRVFIGEWSGLVGVTLETGIIAAGPAP